MRISIRGETFELLPERCLFWPSRRLLAVADCHFGKAETFQQRGLWLPSTSMQQDLATLSGLAEQWKPQRILFLGDLVHSSAGVTDEIVQDVAVLLGRFAGHVQVVVGNHDAGLTRRWPPSWKGVELCDSVRIEDFVFQHQLPDGPIPSQAFCWAGHVHPMMALERGPDRMRLPAFAVSRFHGVLPAFSSLAGGFDVVPSNWDRIFVVGQGDVYEV